MNRSHIQPAAPDNLPRILVIHDHRSDARATADLLRQLLLGYPPEKLAWWYCLKSELHARPDLPVGSHHHFRIPPRLVPSVRLTALKSALVDNFWVPLAARHLEKTLAVVKPELVLGLLYGWSVPVLARVRWPETSRRHFSLWDYPDTQGMVKILGPARVRRAVDMVYQLIRRADSFDAISHGALEEIRAHTGRTDGLLVHSGFEPGHLAALETPASHPSPAADAIRIAYVGTIISEAGFLGLLAALKEVRSRLAQPVSLEFFGGRNYRRRDWFEPDWMVEHGVFTDEGLVAALRRCSWGIVVMDPEGDDLRYSRFSFPNKIGTYLSAGVPILGYGHAQSSLAQIMRTYRLGQFSSELGRDVLGRFLKECLQITDSRAQYRDGILECARTEFDAAAMRERLWRRWRLNDGE